MPISIISSLFLINIIWQFVAFDMWERAYTVKPDQNILSGALIGSLIFTFLLLPFIFLGLALGQFGDNILVRDSPFIYFLTDMVSNEESRMFLLIFAICVHLSTVDMYILSSCLATYKDILDIPLNGNANSKNSALKARSFAGILTAISALIGYCVATRIIPGTLIQWLVGAFSLQLIMFPALIFKRYFTNDQRNHDLSLYTLVSIISGLIVFIISFYLIGTDEILSYWVPAIGIVGAGIGILFVDFYLKFKAAVEA